MTRAATNPVTSPIATLTHDGPGERHDGLAPALIGA